MSVNAANTPSPALYTMNHTWSHNEEVTVNGYSAESTATTQSNGTVRTVYYPSLGETYCDYNFRYAPGFITNNISHDKYYRVNTSCRVDLSSLSNAFYVTGNSAFWTWGGNMVSVGIGQVNTSTIFVRGRDLIYLVNNNPDAFVFEGGLFHCNFNVHTFGSSATNVSNIKVKFDFNFTFNFYEVSEQDFVNNTTTTIVSDVGNQQAMQESNNLAQQGNTLAEQGNTLAEQGNDIAQENADTNKDTNNKITSFFNSFFDNLVHIFVPEDGFFQSWFNELNDFFAAKLGFLYAPFDFIISFFNGVLNTVGTQEHGFTIPALKWEDTEFCPEVHFSFDIFAEQFPQLQEAVYFFSDVVIILALMRGIRAKLDLVMGVHEE